VAAFPSSHPQAEVVFREVVTALVGGGKLPGGGLCGRTFHVQFSARNDAGYSAVATSTTTYTMPDCPGADAAAATAAAAAAADSLAPKTLLCNLSSGLLVQAGYAIRLFS